MFRADFQRWALRRPCQTVYNLPSPRHALRRGASGTLTVSAKIMLC